MAGLTKKGDTYYALFTVNRKTKWKRIGKISFKEAKEFLRKLESQYDKNMLGLIAIKPISFNEYSAHYLNFSKANKALGSWERDITSNKALSSFFGSMMLESIDNETIELPGLPSMHHPLHSILAKVSSGGASDDPKVLPVNNLSMLKR